jgi:DNA repair protein RadC
MTAAPHLDPLLPRERALLDGFDALADDDLVALLLGTGAPGFPVARVARDLLDATGGVDGLATLGPHAVAARPGVGLAKAARLVAAIELGRRAAIRAAAPRSVLASSADVARWASPRLAHLDHEQIWVLALDGRNGLRAARRVGEGGLHGCSIAPRDVLRIAVREAASALVLVHNHPGGDPTPSHEDVVLTETVARAADVVGTPLVDHVVVARGGHASLHDLGLLSDPR